MRLIDADLAAEMIRDLAKEPDYQHEGEDWRSGLYMAEEVLDRLPAVDIVEQIFTDIEFDVTITVDGPKATYDFEPVNWDGKYFIDIYAEGEYMYRPKGTTPDDDYCKQVANNWISLIQMSFLKIIRLILIFLYSRGITAVEMETWRRISSGS